MKPDMSVEIAGVTLKNPVMTASGTFGSGKEYSEYFELSDLGAVVTKGIAQEPWKGNPTPRVAETPAGMLNAIGLMGPGVEAFLRDDMPYLASLGTKVIVNVCGHSEEEYLAVIETLSDVKDIDLLELNISCPNVKAGGIAFGTDPKKAEALTRAAKEKAAQPLIVKLSPNVTDIREIAKAAESGGADAVSLINTITGMKIDVKTRRFVLANKTGGLSGPAIHPVAVRMVYEVSNAVDIPVIGMGGIASAEDAIEFMMAGASAVAVGMFNFHDPCATVKIVRDMQTWCASHGVEKVSSLTGIVNQ